MMERGLVQEMLELGQPAALFLFLTGSGSGFGLASRTGLTVAVILGLGSWFSLS